MIGAIGVAVDEADRNIAGEFFELFKTPWEPAVAGRRYPAMLVSDGRSLDGLGASVILAYGSGEWRSGDRVAVATSSSGPVEVAWGEDAFPVYGRVATFGARSDAATLTLEGKRVDHRCDVDGRTVWRIGYDLFAEVRHLLTHGQPARFALVPTLELHIALVRHILQQCLVPFVEVPPRPAGYALTCCLTHDIDFFGIQRHTFDRTMAGFVARASVGTAVEFLQRRRPMSDVVRNWKALCSLPFVKLRLLRDFWAPVDDYIAADNGRPSTFFVIPFKGEPGVAPDRTVNHARAVAYGAGDVRDELSRAAAHGHEIALHGIDAWRDADRGRAERAQLRGPGQSANGVRMHWLYFSDDSPQVLEAAGFDYDSTWGYNEAVGYRAGTAQVFRLTGARALLELPLLIMDSALFFRDRMHLTADEALRLCCRIVSQVRRFGGALVINWHDRSLSPERLWDGSYRALLADISKDERVWFATASEAVAWFRWRRSIDFEVGDAGRVTIASSVRDERLPPACVRVYQRSSAGEASVSEVAFAGDRALTVA